MSAAPTFRCVPLPVSGAPPVLDTSVWYAQGLTFECQQCANCCSGAPGYVWITPEDMNRQAAFLRISFEDFTRRYIRQVGQRYALIEKFNYDCIFLSRQGKGETGCLIYPVRPTQCRTWPFWNENLRSREQWDRAAAKCPGIRSSVAARYDLTHIETCRQHPENP